MKKKKHRICKELLISKRYQRGCSQKPRDLFRNVGSCKNKPLPNTGRSKTARDFLHKQLQIHSCQ